MNDGGNLRTFVFIKLHADLDCSQGDDSWCGKNESKSEENTGDFDWSCGVI